jgi:toxin ParE1/3/4
MKPRIIIRPAALIDIEEISVWLGSESPAASARFLKNCMSDFESLALQPLMGRVRHFRNPTARNIRSWIVNGFPNHFIFYRPVDDGVEILHVLHGARDLDSWFN